MAIPFERWHDTWTLLSMDRSRPFLGDLWLRVSEPTLFQEGIRTILRPSMTPHAYWRDAPTAHVRIAEWVRGRYGAAAFTRLRDWTVHILVHDGSDRSAEGLWSSLIHYLDRNGSDQPSWMQDVVRRLCTELKRLDAMLAARAEVQRDPRVSPWDGLLLPLPYQHRSISAIDDEIDVIARLNNFLLAWRATCSELGPEHLQELQECGRRLAGDGGWDWQSVIVPGTWQVDLADLIEEGAAGGLVLD